jgi:hypothetical protein
MRNDSVETLLSRHYGSIAPAPSDLEQRLLRSTRQRAQEMRQQDQLAERIRDLRVSRRRALHLVALGSAGLGLLSVAVSALETSIKGQEPAFS